MRRRVSEVPYTPVMPAPGQTFHVLSADDVESLQLQRACVESYLGNDETSRAHYGTVAGKLGLLRAILEANVLSKYETYEMQCLGIVLGDAFVQQCKWLWRMVEDEHGRDPCLKVNGSSVILFPMTMISKRIERGETVDVFALFDQAIAHAIATTEIAAARPD